MANAFIEKCAEAIAKKDHPLNWSEACPEVRENYREQARACLMAAYEPTKGMISAAWDLTVAKAREEALRGKAACQKTIFPQKMRGRWQAMIDRAIQD